MTYHLDQAEWPTIPIPHDCIVTNISFSDDFLVFDFEQDISIHDSIQYIYPNAKSLTIKIHLIDTFDIYQEKRRKFPKYKRFYHEIEFDHLVSLVKQKSVAYLYHHVAYQSLIIRLDCHADIILELRTDYIEYVWEV